MIFWFYFFCIHCVLGVSLFYLRCSEWKRKYEDIACRSWEYLDFLKMLVGQIKSYTQCHVRNDTQIDVFFEIEKGSIHMEQNTKHAARKTQITDRWRRKHTHTTLKGKSSENDLVRTWCLLMTTRFVWSASTVVNFCNFHEFCSYKRGCVPRSTPGPRHDDKSHWKALE